jgi:7-cyano-7-deazaguanine synthase
MGQRHAVEVTAAAAIARALGAREHRIMRVDLAGIGGSALTDETLARAHRGERGNSDHLCSRAQHHHVVVGAGLGRRS